MVPHNYSSYLLNSSDRIVMDLYKVNLNRIGLYNIAYQFGNYFEAFGEAVGMAVGPFYSKLYTEKKPSSLIDARNLTFFLMGIFLLATFLTALWLKQLFILLIHNPDLRSAYDIGILIIMGYAYRPMYWSAGIKLSIHEKTSLLWKISFVAGILNVLLNIIFVPRFGIYAAAVTTLVSLLYIGFAGYFFKSYKRIQGPAHYPLVWMLSILICTAAAYLLRNVSIEAKTIVSVSICMVAFYLFRKNYHSLSSIQI